MTTKSETKLIEILAKEFPNAKQIKVNDISGGCGAMFEIHVQTIDFKGLNTVKQHMIVNNVSKCLIKTFLNSN